MHNTNGMHMNLSTKESSNNRSLQTYMQMKNDKLMSHKFVFYLVKFTTISRYCNDAHFQQLTFEKWIIHNWHRSRSLTWLEKYANSLAGKISFIHILSLGLCIDSFPYIQLCPNTTLIRFNSVMPTYQFHFWFILIAD